MSTDPSKIFAIKATFAQPNGGWSKVYIYKSSQYIPKGTVGIVEDSKLKFFKTVSILESIEDYAFSPNIPYKYILAVFTPGESL
jgi:hypothetical protein